MGAVPFEDGVREDSPEGLRYDIPGASEALDEYDELRGWNHDGTVPESATRLA